MFFIKRNDQSLKNRSRIKYEYLTSFESINLLHNFLFPLSLDLSYLVNSICAYLKNMIISNFAFQPLHVNPSNCPIWGYPYQLERRTS